MKKIKPIIFVIIFLVILFVVGETTAYYTSEIEFDNEFQAGFFETEATETFQSPESWQPGDTTPKTIVVKNTGTVDVKARICLTESWTSHNGNPLPNYQNGNKAALLNLINTNDWTKKGNCYEYNEVLEPNETTNSFIESVTFNPLIEPDVTCTTTNNNGVSKKTCTSSGDGYDNATYTLNFKVETVQENVATELFPSTYTVYTVNKEVSGEHNSYVNLYEEIHSSITEYDNMNDAMINFNNYPMSLRHIIGTYTGWCMKEAGYDECTLYYNTQNDCENDLLPYLNDDKVLCPYNENYCTCNYVVKDNVVLESYTDFIISDDFVQANPGSTAGRYSIRGGGGEYDSNAENFISDSPFYETNKQIMNSAFGSSNCEESQTQDSYYCSLVFDNNTINAYASIKGEVGSGFISRVDAAPRVNITNSGCSIHFYGSGCSSNTSFEQQH